MLQRSFPEIKAIALLLFSVLLMGCVNRAEAVFQTTQAADQKNFSLLPSDGSSFYYYVGDDRLPLTPSLHWVAVKFVSTDPAERSAALHESIVDTLKPVRELPDPAWTILPLQENLTAEALIEGINVLRADRARVRQANPVFLAEGAEMIVTDEFIATFPVETGKEDLQSINSAQHVEIVESIIGQANTYVLRVTQESRLDALSMANLYRESGWALESAPNFTRIIKK